MRDPQWTDTVFTALRPVRSLVCLLPGIRQGTPRRNLLLGSLYTLVVALLVVGL